jgi:hypothetical protein
VAATPRRSSSRSESRAGAAAPPLPAALTSSLPFCSTAFASSGIVDEVLLRRTGIEGLCAGWREGRRRGTWITRRRGLGRVRGGMMGIFWMRRLGLGLGSMMIG